MGTKSFLGVKRPGCGIDHPPPSRAKAEGRVGLYLYSPSGTTFEVVTTLKWRILQGIEGIKKNITTQMQFLWMPSKTILCKSYIEVDNVL